MRFRGSRADATLAALLAAGAASCESNLEKPETACPEARERLGHRVCVHQVPDQETWTSITYAADAVDQARATLYLVPARDDARLPTLFIDANPFKDPEHPERPPWALHYRFLTSSFPEFASLEQAEYVDLIEPHDRREWFAGGVIEYVLDADATLFGFHVWDEQMDVETSVTCEQFRELHAIMAGRIEVGSVAVVPAMSFQREILADCDVPVHDPA